MEETDNKNNEEQEMTNRIEFKGVTLLVNNKGVIYDENGRELK